MEYLRFRCVGHLKKQVDVRHSKLRGVMNTCENVRKPRPRAVESQPFITRQRKFAGN